MRYKATAASEYDSLLERHIVPFFGDLALSEISAPDVQRFVAEQVKRGFAARSVRNQLVVLRAVLRTAEALGLVESNVAMKVKPPREHRKEQRFLTPAELSAVLASTPEAWKPLIAMPIYTAARKAEVIGLRWPQVSFKRRQVAFVRSMRSGAEYTVKTSSSRASVVMSEALVPLLLARRERCPDPDNGYVFCYADGRPLSDRTPNVQLTKACGKAGIEPCTFHQLRHSAIAALISTGAHPKVVQEFARHSSIETTMDVYGHLLAPASSNAVGALNRLIAKGGGDVSE